MGFDDRARVASNHARRVGQSSDRPDIDRLARRQTTSRVVFMSGAVVLLLLGLLIAGPFQGDETAAIPATTTTTLPIECVLTVPTGDFVPPQEYPAVPPEIYNAEWHGSAGLWTMVPPDGARWEGLPQNSPGLFTQKVFYWTEGYLAMSEPVPPLVVVATDVTTGERHEFSESDVTGGFNPDIGNFMIAGIELPAGCWELFAELDGVEVAFVVEIVAPTP